MKRTAVQDLIPGMQLSRSVVGKDGRVIFEACLFINSEHISRLKAESIEEVHIIDVERIDEEINAWDELIEKGFRSVRKRTMRTAGEFLDRISGGESETSESGGAVLDVMEKALEEGNILVKLSGINAVDNYLYAHSVNTATLALLIARSLGADRGSLVNLAKAALMADVGMMLVPSSTWEHDGPLTEEQRQMVQMHVQYSRDIMSGVPGVMEDIVTAVFQHHERSDGSGYPEGLSGDRISREAKIIAVADVFAAIREPRAYRQQSGPVRALKAITSSRGFDPDVMRRFLANVSIYPVQSIVLLSNGMVGSVANVRENNPFRPVVDILRDENGNPGGDLRIDLNDETWGNVYIEEALDSMPD